ncbi:ZYRO0G11528p [Zygosaccharomyces rouxii]|uniref:ZYRO0G11528p n=1 Tax=Zygosaccharomyces rouxii (strain ATCC 2623 / CBS 732 / NBRC 1130 / NCYC 568 / NRRL Y-229) TaxID=559307 RepID=C5E0C2_ZYGRC|nr:uncharacterized protein ZYRO0G11528g [Zygosaccharomyces rouxii]KAH9202549.1 thioesterase-like superfamily-domain-containing protein [Zygosaccharomyces rouxii]CAR29556.1 ZYRO0G11528p [Zygosaccharomyces rouxii]
MESLFADIEKILELQSVSKSIYRSKRLGIPPVGSRGTFGGILLGQSLLAAMYTVPTTFVPSSLHCYFVNGGDPTVLLQYEVEDIRRGKSFLHQQVKAYQADKLVSIVAVLWSLEKQVSKDALHYFKTLEQDEFPPMDRFEDAGPLYRRTVIETNGLKRLDDDLPSFRNFKLRDTFLDSFFNGCVDHRFPTDFFHSHGAKKKLDYYVRIRDLITNTGRNEAPQVSVNPRNDFRYNYVAFCYLSDSYFIFTVPNFHGLPLFTYKFSVSLDHSIHFHGVPEVNGWMYMRIHNPRSYKDKHLVQGEYFNAETGQIVASTSQEGLTVYHSEKKIREMIRPKL